MKPRSIQLFDRLYLGGLAVSLVSTIAYWDKNVEIVLAEPDMPFGVGFLIFTALAGFAISLLLWFLISKLASKVAKWIFVVLFGIGTIVFVASFFEGGAPLDGLELLLALAGTGLQTASMWMLFRPDAKAWFSGRVVNPAIFE